MQKRQCKSRGIWQCLLGCLTLLGMFLCLFPVHYSGMELTFLDVGQGDACFIRTSDGITFLIDGGSSDEKQVGEYRLEPFLDCKAVGQVDFAMVSHGDSDHLNGIRELMERERIGTLVLPGRNSGFVFEPGRTPGGGRHCFYLPLAKGFLWRRGREFG